LPRKPSYERPAWSDPGPDIHLPDYISVGDALREVGGMDQLRQALYPTALSAWEMRRWNELRDARFFLVRNRGGDTGERYRCGNHSYTPGIDAPVYHEFFTVMCVDRPWRGLDGALWGYALVTRDDLLAEYLMTFAPGGMMRAHPQMTASLAPRKDEADLIALAVGTLEPISETRALALARDIQSRRPPRPFIL
jgi:hypothetical protein